ncbi:oligopeptide/dipeptide ABC transporter ATP-binding protein [Actimicrobium sp. CCI2.3]|uniref:oligopeptide/dipeptide ABC transporter ATP-binding protein n=1 Tax=Actimicrobium sp. CCI2.3 TaxID=3048616 RepID=UPI002AB5B929|nr:oligopeptide/dipeptide ABC transporter ATP-binding protein [Actimicrobium sp. CCI2.3]MDY7576047.1 ATP-binding cassette domain-containing protein [Actimicrobium sp. CCI2.3]MEB0022977.1 ATP-binding cassette domain-containing protein [Actimicrobium sp. CCI2.3]
MALLELQNLRVEFGSEKSPFTAVDGLDLTIAEGEVVGIVGESGSGKSVTSLALMGLIDYPGRVTATRMAYDGRELQTMSERERRGLLGKDIAMIFQDPMTSLNPCFTVAYQLIETLRVHQRGSNAAMRAKALELLQQVDIPDPERRLDAYPHQLSGGMSQRVMVAMAIACSPRLLIADEPTTALDVTVQSQMLELLLQLQRDRGMALMLITHDLSVIAQTAQRVVVMYAGQVVETGSVPAIFNAPRHPYTQALLAALPEHNVGRARLQTIPGVVPGQYDRSEGCLLSPRCAYANALCHTQRPALTGPAEAQVRCHFPLDTSGQPTNNWHQEEVAP